LSDRSTVRAGWGIFYDLGFSVATDPINGFPFNRWQFGDVLTGTSGQQPLAGAGYVADLRLPYSQEVNVTWEQATGRSGALAVSYVGSPGRKLLREEAGLGPGDPVAVGRRATDPGGWDVPRV